MYSSAASGKEKGYEEPGPAISDDTGIAGGAPDSSGSEGDELDRYIEQVGRFIPRGAPPAEPPEDDPHTDESEKRTD